MAAARQATSAQRERTERDVLTLVFDIHINKKYGVVKPDVPRLDVVRGQQARLREITEHLEQSLTLPTGDGRFLLLQAICGSFHARTRRSARETTSHDLSPDPPPLGLTGVVPLVCDEIWAALLCNYGQSRIKILVERKRSFLSARQSCTQRLLSSRSELSFLNTAHYLPSRGLRRDDLSLLAQRIFQHGVRVKPKLRKGVWLHLVGAYHPSLSSREEREGYVEKLRRVYDSLKGKWHGIDGVRNAQMRRLYEAVRRDAVRTDPTQPFYTHRGRPPTESYTRTEVNFTQSEAEDNIQKLINIIVIYTLEHDGVSYTQGMSDILSPILFVMEREADAYICFSAMLERIRSNFSAWCEGTLNKLERLRHICQVLDPQLYSYLSTGIEEDAFALFFGMVLIECRREFTFDDSFHLFETIWAGVTCMKDAHATLPTNLSPSQWARYMTYESQDVVMQVFGETESPYSAVPLPRGGQSESQSQHLYYSRHTSLLSQSPVTIEHRGGEEGDSLTGAAAAAVGGAVAIGGRRSASSVATNASINQSGGEGGRKSQPVEIVSSRRWSFEAPPLPSTTATTQAAPDHRERSFTDPSRRLVVADTAPEPANSHSESELYDSFAYNHPSNPSFPPPSRTTKALRGPQEMSDMSSISSGTISNSNGLLASYRSANTKNSTSSERHAITPEVGSDVEAGVTVTTRESDDAADLEEPHTAELEGVSSGTDNEPTEDTAEPLEDTELKAATSSPQSPNPPPSTITSTTTVVVSHPSASDSIASLEQTPEELPDPPRLSPTSEGLLLPLVTQDGAGVVTMSQNAARSAELVESDLASLPSSENVTGQSPSIQSSSYSNSNVFKNSLSASHSSFDRSGRLTPGSKTHKTKETRRKGAMEKKRLPPFTAAASSTEEEEEREEEGRGVLLTSEQSSRNHTPVRHKRRKRTRSPPHGGSSRASPYNDDFLSSSARVTPVAFFDTMDQMVSSLSVGNHGDSGPPSSRDESIQLRSRGNSDVSLILSQMRSNEEAAPLVTRAQSLDVPFSDSFPLFICLSILVQSRKQILQQTLDFVGLSVLLNTQAGVQNLDATLRVAKQLYKTYKEYQVMCFGQNAAALNTWLDDTGMESPEEPNHGEIENSERDARTSPTPDSVFD